MVKKFSIIFFISICILFCPCIVFGYCYFTCENNCYGVNPPGCSCVDLGVCPNTSEQICMDIWQEVQPECNNSR